MMMISCFMTVSFSQMLGQKFSILFTALDELTREEIVSDFKFTRGRFWKMPSLYMEFFRLNTNTAKLIV
jgi:hypothetical protein